MRRFESYTISGCEYVGGNSNHVEQCPDYRADFWTLYGRLEADRDYGHRMLVAIGDRTSREACEELAYQLGVNMLLE